MEITVKKDELIAEIEKGLSTYETEYKKGLDIYRKKLRLYAEYLEKHIDGVKNGDDPTNLKSPPYTPHWKRDNFVDMLESLRAHQQATIEMDDHEYNNARHGIQDLAMGQTVSNLSMDEVTY